MNTVIEFVYSFLISIAHAQAISTGGASGIVNPIAANDFFAFTASVLNTVKNLAIVVSAIAIIYSGFLFVVAQGNEEKLKTAKRAITYTLIGVAIATGAALIAQVISSTINNIK